jgi:hypothetical protein
MGQTHDNGDDQALFGPWLRRWKSALAAAFPILSFGHGRLRALGAARHPGDHHHTEAYAVGANEKYL